MANKEYQEHLTNKQIVDLARAISSTDMKSIASGYLNVKESEIRNIEWNNRNAEAFNRGIIRQWITKNPGLNQCQVSSNV